MTPRQHEFIRHYLSGMPAPDAAVAAGYARSTSEKNASLILSSKSIAAKLAEVRIRAQEPVRQAVAAAITNLQEILATESDIKARLFALREMRGWCRQLERLGPPTSLLDEILGPPTTSTNTSGKSVANSWENGANDDQNTDDQHDDAEIKNSTNPIKHAQYDEDVQDNVVQAGVVQGLQPLHARQAGVRACEHPSEDIPEVDHLPDDTEAADTRLAPRKPSPPKRPPTVITFRLPDKQISNAS